MIACCPGEGATTTRGCLIDLDRSKLGARNPRTLPSVRTRSKLITKTQMAFLSASVVFYFQERENFPVSLSLQPEVISSAYDVLGVNINIDNNYTIAAIEYSLAFPPAQENYIITTDRLGWHHVCFVGHYGIHTHTFKG